MRECPAITQKAAAIVPSKRVQVAVFEYALCQSVIEHVTSYGCVQRPELAGCKACELTKTALVHD